MSTEKAKATVSDICRAVANKDGLQTQFYNLSAYLSSSIDQLLGDLLFALQRFQPNSPERPTALYAIDGLLRLKIDFRQGEGVHCG